MIKNKAVNELVEILKKANMPKEDALKGLTYTASNLLDAVNDLETVGREGGDVEEAEEYLAAAFGLLNTAMLAYAVLLTPAQSKEVYEQIQLKAEAYKTTLNALGE